MVDNEVVTQDQNPPLQEDRVTDATPPSAWRSWLVPSLVTLGIIALVAIALLRGNAQYDPTTPEGAVQEYLQALADKRWQDALDVLDPVRFAGCEEHHITSIFIPVFSARHDSTHISGSNAQVGVFFEATEGAMWGNSWWEQFTLYEDGGFWYITDHPWPYFANNCVPLR